MSSTTDYVGIMDINNFDVIFFDCDGVIFDSNNFKIDAFINSIIKNTNYIDDECVACIHRNYGRFNRVEIFERVLSLDRIRERVAGTEDILGKLLTTYSNICYQSYLAASFLPGFGKFIDMFPKIRKYVVSASDENELKKVFYTRNIFDTFYRIYGNKKPKKEILTDFLVRDRGLNCIFIGDSLSDLKAANSVGIPFIFMEPKSIEHQEIKEIISTDSLKTVKSFYELM
ncbi:MAG: HAD family hydrolase [Oligoflexales bacterium]|nr:HAD family hydrolase [Oligoflexales bacterium]